MGRFGITLIGAVVMAEFAVAQGPQDTIVLQGGDLSLNVSKDGQITSVQGPPNARALLAAEEKPILFGLAWDGKAHHPTSARLDAASGRLDLSYGDTGVTAIVEVRSAPTHIRLTLLEVRGAKPDDVTLIRLPTRIKGRVGATVGVIRDDATAIGVQALNMQTTAGAAPAGWGGVLTASAKETQGGIKGAGMALFACPAAQALERIGAIEIAEGLPHPILDGQWNKISPTARRPYLIISYGVGNIDEVLALAQRGGFKFIYHANPFETWGRFILRKSEYPEGDKSLRECADKAEKFGIRIGFHTLTAFITTNDPYVTPVPDPRLARTGSSKLSAAIDAAAKEIPVADAEVFRKRIQWDAPLNTVIIGKELVRFGTVSDKEPWRLLDCERGAFKTTAAAHNQGDDIGKLADHGYRTFYPGIANGMADEMAGRLVELGNACHAGQISFDGIEGLIAYEAGGQYPECRFVDLCHRGWKQHVISDSSGLLHYNWHWHTRMNWGELTQSAKMDIDSYRANNCQYFRDNLFPAAMGWWRIGTTSLDWEATRMEDVQYLLAKAAGNNATHALCTEAGILKAHGQAGQVFDSVREWDEARFSNAFSEEQCAKLRERGKDFDLRKVQDRVWDLTPVSYGPFYWYSSGEGRKAKPGTLTFASVGKPRPQPPFQVQNPYAAQPVRFEIRCLPAYDYDHAENIDLTPSDPAGLVREAGLPKEAPTLTATRDGQIAGQNALRLTTAYKGADKPSFVTRLCYALPKPLDLSKNRGLGLWVEGDGKGETLFVEIQDGNNVRPFYVPIDFIGERYIELPLGEVSLSRFYDYEWNNWSAFASWWVTLKGFNYTHVAMVTVGYNAIPPNTEVKCRVAGIRALRELPAKLAKVNLSSGGQTLEFQPDLEPFQYLIYAGAGVAQVCDPNYHDLRTVASAGQLVLQPGANDLTIACEASGRAPWLRFQAKSAGAAERVHGGQPSK
ncbi:MAG: hypothetical protein PHR35_18700 [Kiritimatiellae bacterium]|nr:hypothetical protein [Kiritimatiellia bacterium]